MKKQNKGFSLVELLVVLGIIVLLASISVPVVTSITKGADLGFAADQASGQLNLARQTALTMNRPMEIRVYETKDSSGFTAYNAVGIYEVGDDENADGTPDSFTLQGKIQFLPPGSVFLKGSLSTLINDVAEKSEATIPGKGLSKYSAFRFKPTGEGDLTSAPASGTDWKLTIAGKKDAAATALPANYAVLTLNPAVGIVRITRP